jgi:hypothetical protein
VTAHVVGLLLARFAPLNIPIFRRAQKGDPLWGTNTIPFQRRGELTVNASNGKAGNGQLAQRLLAAPHAHATSIAIFPTYTGCKLLVAASAQLAAGFDW